MGYGFHAESVSRSPDKNSLKIVEKTYFDDFSAMTVT